MAPVAPNGALVDGVLMSVEEGTDLSKRVLYILVENTTAVPGLLDWVASEVGKVIPVIISGAYEMTIHTDFRIRIGVCYRGDEHGGNFYEFHLPYLVDPA